MSLPPRGRVPDRWQPHRLEQHTPGTLALNGKENTKADGGIEENRIVAIAPLSTR